MFWNKTKEANISIPFYNQHKTNYYKVHINLHKQNTQKYKKSRMIKRSLGSKPNIHFNLGATYICSCLQNSKEQ